ncbi:MAG: polymer-forming cytoskeletal protein [Halobacteriovoraceae bacterium]|nr:polymer-forming cytoskeletal protein [Halobacteriovoraceae bacterium]
MKNQAEEITAIIEKGCRFEGNLSFNGVVRIAGEFTGSIFTNDTLIVTDTAVINADVHAGVIVISGTVKGNLRAGSRVEMKKPARFEGTVISPNLIVEEGVIFHGETKIKDQV